MMSTQHGDVRRTRVVVIGSGFGGPFAARALRRADVDVTLIARTGHHLFQPLRYQVATGILSEVEIAVPTREVLRRQKNARVVLGEVTDIDLDARMVVSSVFGRTNVHVHDELIVAAGARPSYVVISRAPGRSADAVQPAAGGPPHDASNR
jgi:NADH:ubiquinone reductase (H+-translocating)